MTIDERLEALAHSLELLSGMHEAAAERHDSEIEALRASQAKTENTLRRAIRMGVADARRQRQRSREFDERMTELQRLLKAFLERGGNGKH